MIGLRQSNRRCQILQTLFSAAVNAFLNNSYSPPFPWSGTANHAIHLWIASAREGLVSAIKRFKQFSFVRLRQTLSFIYITGFVVFGVIPYLILFRTTPASKAWLELGLFVGRLIVSFTFTRKATQPSVVSGISPPWSAGYLDSELSLAAAAVIGDREGTVIVMDPRSGRVISVSNPQRAFSIAFAPHPAR